MKDFLINFGQMTQIIARFIGVILIGISATEICEHFTNWRFAFGCLFVSALLMYNRKNYSAILFVWCLAVIITTLVIGLGDKLNILGHLIIIYPLMGIALILYQGLLDIDIYND